MDNSRQHLLEVLDEQKKTIEKYSNKLRDVVAAHKSLLIEKKALEDTIKILNSSKNGQTDGEKNEPKTDDNSDNIPELKNQLTCLLASFSSLVAEKSHMEECFKTNQKQLLDDKEAVENKCKELQQQVKILSKQLKSVENKNETDLALAKKNNKGRNSKQPEGLENELLSLQVKNYEKEMKNLRSELEAKSLIQEVSEKKLKESSLELSRLQEEVRNLQIEHEMAIQSEKEKAKSVEKHAKKLTAVQEERVINLETRLAELSETIGTYDRLRLQDQIEIQKLKEHIAFINMGQKGLVPEHSKPEALNHDDFDSLVAKFIELKKQLQIAAQKHGREDDVGHLLFENTDSDEIHSLCREEYNKLNAEFEYFKNEVKLFSAQAKSGKEVIVLQNQTKNLQEKVRMLGEKNKEMEKEYQVQIEQLKKMIKNEKAKYKDVLAASETDHKARVWLLEEQLQKQRERSLALLEEKEQEIHALQSTFQMFLPGYKRKSQDESGNDSSVLGKNQFVDGPHIVHYANELARRDVEISSLRRAKHQTETMLRDLQKEIASTMEKHREEKRSLCDEIARLERCQTREGANLEYLKNVVYNFLLSSDPKSKRHMCNAIAAVLKFSETELQRVIEHSKNSWWTRSNIL